MQLYVDIGNQRIKWASDLQIREWFQSEDMVSVARAVRTQSVEYHRQSVHNSLDLLFENSQSPASVHVASVADPSVSSTVRSFCADKLNIEADFAITGTHFNGLTNGYAEPGRLGVDRWLAMIGGRTHMPGQDLLIIDAGTAVTVDYVGSDGKYSGGIIFPGVSTMADSLNMSTGQIRIKSDFRSDPAIQMQNASTKAAVSNGALHAVVSSVESAINYFSGLEGKKFETIITGGDAELVFNLSGKKMHLLPQLVLSGLMVFSGEVLR